MFIILITVGTVFLSSAPLDTASGLGLISCGEDGSFMVWEGTEAVQSIFHPCCVWCAASLPGTGGDFVTGGHDGFIRHFSKDPAKTMAPAALVLQQHFEEQVCEV
jgi:WD40 repeat protein